MGGRLVILGNGGAAVSAARAARLSGYEGEIRMVSDTADASFNPMLGPYYLKGHIPWEGCFPFGSGFYREYDITCSFGASVELLNPVNQEVTLAGGKRLSYDRCLIATGASPGIPPISGLKNSSRTFVLRTAASVKSLEKVMSASRKAVVLGASFVGLKVAEILKKRGIGVVLLDVVDQLLPRGAHPEVAALLKTYLENRGVDVRLDCTMEGMEGAREGVVCRFSDSIIEEADFVVVCTGVRPNTGFVSPEQVDMDQAILVDVQMRTSAPNLYAAGDASRGRNLLSGNSEWFGTWQNACYQGRTAGHNMAGGDAAYYGSLQENISPFFEWIYAQVGDVLGKGPDSRHITFGNPGDRGYGLLAFENDVLVGTNLINCTELAGLLRRAIIRKARWSEHLESWGETLAADTFALFLRSVMPVETRHTGVLLKGKGL
jgi:NADPH-dependent 2,4-dienoyl-CoA reductase/sulfur reductase-like enzyme